MEEGLKHEQRNLEAVYVWDEEAVGQNIAEGMEYSEFSPELHVILKDVAINEVLPKRVCDKRGSGGLETFEHQVDHGDMYPGFAALGALLIVLAQPSTSAQPGQSTLHYPPSG